MISLFAHASVYLKKLSLL